MKRKIPFHPNPRRGFSARFTYGFTDITLKNKTLLAIFASLFLGAFCRKIVLGGGVTWLALHDTGLVRGEGVGHVGGGEWARWGTVWGVMRVRMKRNGARHSARGKFLYFVFLPCLGV